MATSFQDWQSFTQFDEKYYCQPRSFWSKTYSSHKFGLALYFVSRPLKRLNFVIRMPVMPIVLVRAYAGLSNTSLAVATVKS